jgi:hypothetical protein
MDKDPEVHKEQIFKILDTGDTEKIKYPMFVKFMKLSWFFLQNDKGETKLLSEN